MEIRQLAERFDLEEDEFLELLMLFLETCTSDLERLQSALDAGNVSDVVEAAHSIRGASVNLGFMDISSLAAELEKNARENRLQGSDGALTSLREGFELISRKVSGNFSEYQS